MHTNARRFMPTRQKLPLSRRPLSKRYSRDAPVFDVLAFPFSKRRTAFRPTLHERDARHVGRMCDVHGARQERRMLE